MKVFYIVPYLSTGGMPEYLKNKIDKIKDEADVWVFEKRYEPAYVTVRKRIEKIVGQDRLIVWGDKPEEILLGAIRDIKPDVIHFEEPCEQFLSSHILDQIFTPDREYKIFETMHDSSVNPLEKIYLPDKFIVVSPWQVYLLQDLKVPIEVIEHEIVKKTSRDYEGSRQALGLDPNKKHIVQIGIFTPRKNQLETANIAKVLPDVQFHFVGTLAENFKWYWEPIVNGLSENCKIWGERDDVDLFYQAADLIIFPSIALFNDKETSPLVIKEAISWKAPLLLRNLNVYVDMYQESENLFFFKNNSILGIADQISEIFNIERKKEDIKMFTHTYEPEQNKITMSYHGDGVTDGNLVCDVFIKDADSGANIFSFGGNFSPGYTYWTIPVPIHIYDFYNNPKFGGFLIEYRKGDDLVYQDVLRLKGSIDKKKCRLNTKDPIFRNFEEFFTDRIYDKFTDGIVNRKVAVDVGANVGLFTEYCLDLGFENVTSVEPNPYAVEQFRKLHSGSDMVKLKDIALTPDGSDITLSMDPGNSLVSAINKSVGSNSVLVKSETLDSLISEFPENGVDLLKIDIEGAEYDLIEKSSLETLKKASNIILEFHDNSGQIIPLIDKLKSAGFDPILYDEHIQSIVGLNSDHGVIFAKKSN